MGERVAGLNTVDRILVGFRQLRNRAIREDKIRVRLMPFSQPKDIRVESSKAYTPATSGNGSLGFLNSPGCRREAVHRNVEAERGEVRSPRAARPAASQS